MAKTLAVVPHPHVVLLLKKKKKVSISWRKVVGFFPTSGVSVSETSQILDMYHRYKF